MTHEELEKNSVRFRRGDQLRAEIRAVKECITHLQAIGAGQAKIGIEFYELPHGPGRKPLMHTAISNEAVLKVASERLVELTEEFERL